MTRENALIQDLFINVIEKIYYTLVIHNVRWVPLKYYLKKKDNDEHVIILVLSEIIFFLSFFIMA